MVTAAVGGPSLALGRLVVCVFLPFAAGYFLSFALRSVNAVIYPYLVQDMSLPAAILGILTATFFLSFAAVQLPLGLLLDRWGPRRVQAALFGVGALGCAIFALSESSGGLVVGRALIGIGMAGGLMASLKALVLWFPERWLALVNGCFLAVGGLGALAATAPLAWGLGFFGWRSLFWGLTLAVLAVAVWIWLVVPDRETGGGRRSLVAELTGLGSVLRDGFFWRVAPLSIAGMGGTLCLQTLWAGPWLADVAGLGEAAAADRLLAMTAAMTVGFVAIGWLADWLRSRGLSSIAVMGGCGLMQAVALAALTFHLDPQGLAAWLLLGFFGNGASLVYPLLSRHFGAERAGRATTANTLLVFSGTFALQAGMGWVISLWPRLPSGGYASAAYDVSVGSLLALLCVSLIVLALPFGRSSRA